MRTHFLHRDAVIPRQSRCRFPNELPSPNIDGLVSRDGGKRTPFDGIKSFLLPCFGTLGSIGGISNAFLTFGDLVCDSFSSMSCKTVLRGGCLSGSANWIAQPEVSPRLSIRVSGPRFQRAEKPARSPFGLQVNIFQPPNSRDARCERRGELMAVT